MFNSKDKIISTEREIDVGTGQVESIDLGEDGYHSKQANKDKALGILAGHNIDFDSNSPEAKRVLRKIDMRIMPMIFTLYLLQLMDKNSLSFAAIMGIKADTHLTASEYSWLGSLVYFGYLFGEVPTMIFMQRVPLAKYIAGMTMLWGIVVALHSACHNFGGLAAVRFLLGAIEVCTAPAAIYITSAWYTREEQITRVAIWYTTSGWASVFGGFFAWAIYQADSFRWQALFIFYGALTFFVGLMLWFFLAVSPTEARWLSEEEKIIALERVRGNKTGTEVWAFDRSQLWETFTDIRLYLIFLLLVSTGLPNGGITAFGPTIIAAFGFSSEETTLLSMAPGAATVVGTFLALFIAKHTNRTFGGIFPVVLGCVGVLMMLKIPSANYAARYGGYVLTLQYPICILSIIAFMTAGVAGTTKKFAFSAAYQLGYAVGNIIGPQTYRADDAPNYYTAKYTMLAFLVLVIILLAAMGLVHKSWNVKRDKQDEADLQNGTIQTYVENEEFLDKTDFQLRAFRYPL